MTQEEPRKCLIEKLLKKPNSSYVTIQLLGNVFLILNNA